MIILYVPVICTGLLAHVEDPVATIEKMISLAESGGAIILQNTNSNHLYSYINTATKFIGALITSERYIFNQISEKTVLEAFRDNNLNVIRRYCYIQSFSILERFLSSQLKYNLIKNIFGSYGHNSYTMFGNECIYYAKKLK